jgi:hypothetical protein
MLNDCIVHKRLLPLHLLRAEPARKDYRHENAKDSTHAISPLPKPRNRALIVYRGTHARATVHDVVGVNGLGNIIIHIIEKISGISTCFDLHGLMNGNCAWERNIVPGAVLSDDSDSCTIVSDDVIAPMIMLALYLATTNDS